MKIFEVISYIIFIFLIASSYTSQASTAPKTFAHVCDISTNIGPNCSLIDDSFLLDKIAPDLTYRPHPSCSKGKINAGSNNCGEIVDFFVSEHTIFDVKNNYIRKVEIRVSPTNNNLGTEYTFTNLSPSSEELGFLAEMVDFRNERVNFHKRLQFTQNADEIMINKNGETLEELLMSFGRFNQSARSSYKASNSSNIIGNCMTMLDYYNNALGETDHVSCRNRLNSTLKEVAKKDESQISNFFSNLKATLKNSFIDVNFEREGNKQKVSFKFGDASVLTIEIAYNGGVEPSIILVEGASYTSEQSTLTQYLNDLSDRAVNQIIFSGRETNTIYGTGFTTCRDFIRTVGYEQKVKVTITERDDDGRSTAWTVELISHQDINKRIAECSQ